MKARLTVLALMTALWAQNAAADFQTITVEETAGIERELWPVQVGVTVPADTPSDSLVLVRVREDGSLQEIDFQLINEIDSHGVDERWSQLRDIKSFEIAFVAALPANAALEFRLYHAEPESEIAPAENSPRLDVQTGEGFARVVDTGAARFDFHPSSGQLIKYELAGTGHVVEFYRGGENHAAHGSGDLRTSRNNVRSWDHEDESHGLTSDETMGPVTWQLVRRGYMPHTDQQIEVNVTYTAFAGMPFIITSSHIQFHSDWAVAALRTNQLVFSRGFHTHGAYMTGDGNVHTARAFNVDDPEEYFGDLGLGSLPAELPFMGMVHEDHGYGIGLVTLNRANQRMRRVAATQDGGAYSHFRDSDLHGVGNPSNFFYLVRYEAYQGNHRLVIPSGSLYSATSAILTYPVAGDGEDDRYDELKRWVEMLRHPPRVYAR